MILKGKAWKFGDDISTDHIAPGRYFHLRSNLPELAKHVLEDADAEFAGKVQKGDFVVGGNNFGLGSSREHAPTIIKDGDEYRIWYTDVGSEPWVFRHASSRDGRAWRVSPDPVLAIDQDWERQNLFYPTVVKVDDVYFTQSLVTGIG